MRHRKLLGFIGFVMFAGGLYLTLAPPDPNPGTLEWLAGASLALALIVIRVVGLGWLCPKG